MKKLLPIVEGDGEVAAAPVLLRRLVIAREAYEVDLTNAFRRPLDQLVERANLQSVVAEALASVECDALLILCDADDSCPASMGHDMLEWASSAARNLPVAVVLANREYEAWFLASIESLRGKCAIRDDAVYPGDPESKRDAKGQLSDLMAGSAKYRETRDQARLSALFDLPSAWRRSRSFRKLVKAFGELVDAMGAPEVEHWPPESWHASPS